MAVENSMSQMSLPINPNPHLLNSNSFIKDTPRSRTEILENAIKTLFVSNFRSLKERALITETKKNEDSDNFVDCFIAAFRMYSEPSAIFFYIRNAFFDPASYISCPTEEDFLKFRDSILRILYNWIRLYFYRDFKGKKPLFFELVDFLSTHELKDFSIANEVKLLIIRSHKNKFRITIKNIPLIKSSSGRNSIRGMNTRSQEADSPLRKPNLMDSFSLQNISSMSSSSIRSRVRLEDLSMTDLAEQMTLEEYKYFAAVKSTDLIGLSWRKDSQSPVTTMINQFNLVSFWVASDLVFIQNIEDRTNCLKKFINLAKKLHMIGNYSSMMQILAGLNNVAIQRLQKTWAGLNPKYKLIFDELDELMETKHNFKRYREAIQKRPLPILPYFGIYTRDLTFIEEGNIDQPNKVNLEKIQLVGNILLEINRCQQVKFNFTNRTFMEQFLKSKRNFTDETIYNQSLIIEPKETLQVNI
eukprot:TRINITY_DN1226_c0_g1_i1.p1 TRINITY_DN1226_c0_g1~~TRINITY_DN1226_c0_g1_i1.p1  ORF type:complete len:472 (-),score=115.81 TRINITY_DN1226_c0_g1_i1:54-1469(-)